MLDVKLWTPDTCLPGDSCKIYFLIDDVNPGVSLGYVTHDQAIVIYNARLIARPNSTNVTEGSTPNQRPRLCSAHAPLGHTPAMYTVVKEENERKNFTLTEIQRILPAVLVDDYIWVYDVNRVLQVSIDARIPVTGATRIVLQNALNTRFGPGKVVVN